LLSSTVFVCAKNCSPNSAVGLELSPRRHFHGVSLEVVWENFDRRHQPVLEIYLSAHAVNRDFGRLQDESGSRTEFSTGTTQSPKHLMTV
jgi:hypothetical protein